jgi:hypothetical protein
VRRPQAAVGEFRAGPRRPWCLRALRVRRVESRRLVDAGPLPSIPRVTFPWPAWKPGVPPHIIDATPVRSSHRRRRWATNAAANGALSVTFFL